MKSVYKIEGMPPETWEKEKFSRNIFEFIEQTQGLNAHPDMMFIGVLTQQIDVYVECALNMAQKGLVADYNKGVITLGQAFTSQSLTSL